MKWVGLDWDEGPLYQTDRLAIYKEQADRLLAEGKAYLCYCTEEELEVRRKEALARKELPKYDGRCRRRSGAAPAGVSPVTRFVSSQDGQTTVHDLIKGDVTFDNAQLDDLVIVRSNGMPTYNFGVVVDDARMAITHVIRGDDHLNNTPRQILLYQALGYEPPQFGHLSMILGMDKVKLSKRHGATSVLEYQEAGYLPEALVNYLVRLGWSHGDQEVFSSQEMIEKFSLENITRSPAAFNPEKLLWLNGHYLKTADTTRVAELLIPFLRKRGVLDGGAQPDSAWLRKLVVALRERSQTLVEMADKAAPFFQESVMMDQDAAKKFLTVAVQPAFARLVAVLDQTSVFEHDALEQGFKSVLAETGLSMGKLAQPVRVALTGGTVSPGIFDVMALLGRERTLVRLKKAIDLMC
jgi:glutamyl-tRNA synthetase